MLQGSLKLGISTNPPQFKEGKPLCVTCHINVSEGNLLDKLKCFRKPHFASQISRMEIYQKNVKKEKRQSSMEDICIYSAS